VYDISTPAMPMEVAKILASDANDTDDFGWTVSLENGLALITSRTDDDVTLLRIRGEFSTQTSDVTYLDNVSLPCAQCPADTNGDGTLSPADFNAWILAFNSQSAACDQNGDGLCTPADFNAWIGNYNAGCP
jgi:hypothetical protein